MLPVLLFLAQLPLCSSGFAFNPGPLNTIQVGCAAPAAVGGSIEASWCPGPVLTLEGPRRLVIGRNWTAAKPCYLHMDITRAIDPLYIAKLTAPVVVTLAEGLVDLDDLMIFVRDPIRTTDPNILAPVQIEFSLKAFNSSPPHNPPTLITCAPSPSTSCNLIRDSGTPRTFPAGSLAIGFAPIAGGAFSPDIHDIVGVRQLYVGGNTPMVVKTFENGYIFELNTETTANAIAQQTLQQVETRARALQIEAAQAVQDAAPRSAVQLQTEVRALAAQVEAALAEVRALAQSKPPSAAELQATRGELDAILEGFRRQIAESTRTASEWQRYGRSYPTFRAAVPADLSGACPMGAWALDSAARYECVEGGWVVTPRIRAPKPIIGPVREP